ncbi:MAG: DnaA N-terminal domain-containing protein, partial [Trueperaceae bacterium]
MSGIDGGIWDDVISRVRDEIPEVEFRTWFSNVTLLGIEDGSFMIGVPTNFARDWIRSHYSAVIESSLQQLGVANPRLGFQLLPSKVPEQQDIFSAQPEPAADAAPARNSAPQLNPKYVFTNFIVGENNNFAHAAAL